MLLLGRPQPTLTGDLHRLLAAGQRQADDPLRGDIVVHRGGREMMLDRGKALA
jgi:hypothetical protein